MENKEALSVVCFSNIFKDAWGWALHVYTNKDIQSQWKTDTFFPSQCNKRKMQSWLKKQKTKKFKMKRIWKLKDKVYSLATIQIVHIMNCQV